MTVTIAAPSFVAERPSRPTIPARVCMGCGSFPCRCGSPVRDELTMAPAAGLTRLVEPCACGGSIRADDPRPASIALAVQRHQQLARHKAWRRDRGL